MLVKGLTERSVLDCRWSVMKSWAMTAEMAEIGGVLGALGIDEGGG